MMLSGGDARGCCWRVEAFRDDVVWRRCSVKAWSLLMAHLGLTSPHAWPYPRATSLFQLGRICSSPPELPREHSSK